MFNQFVVQIMQKGHNSHPLGLFKLIVLYVEINKSTSDLIFLIFLVQMNNVQFHELELYCHFYFKSI